MAMQGGLEQESVDVKDFVVIQQQLLFSRYERPRWGGLHFDLEPEAPIYVIVWGLPQAMTLCLQSPQQAVSQTMEQSCKREIQWHICRLIQIKQIAAL